MQQLAQGLPIGNIGGIGPLSENIAGSVVSSQFDTKFVRVVSTMLGLMTAIAALWFVFTLFTGAIAWLSAGSDKQALDNAKKKITNGVIGLLVVVLAYSIIGVVGYIIGIDIIGMQRLLLSISVVQP